MWIIDPNPERRRSGTYTYPNISITTPHRRPGPFMESRESGDSDPVTNHRREHQSSDHRCSHMSPEENSPIPKRKMAPMLDFISQRQIKGRSVLPYPSSGHWLSDGLRYRSGVLSLAELGDRRVDVPPFAVAFGTKPENGHLLAVADEDGNVNIFNTFSKMPAERFQGDTWRSLKSRWCAHKNAVFDICWTQRDTHMLTASGDQTIKLWNVEKQLAIGVMTGHQGSIKSVSVNPAQNALFVSGSRDGSMRFWDTRHPRAESGSSMPTYRHIAVVHDAHKGPIPVKGRMKGRMKNCEKSVTGAIYLQDERCVASCGANDGVVKFWDTRNLKKGPVAQTIPAGLEPSITPTGIFRLHGISSLALDPSSSRLIATSADDRIYMYNVLHPEKPALNVFKGHRMPSFYVKACFSPDGRHILSGSSDGHAYIWKTDGPGDNPRVLISHLAEVSAVAWCPVDFGKIATCSDDSTVRVWRLAEPEFSDQLKGRSLTGVKDSLRLIRLAEQLNIYDDGEPSAPATPTYVPGSGWSSDEEENESETESEPEPTPALMELANLFRARMGPGVTDLVNDRMQRQMSESDDEEPFHLLRAHQDPLPTSFTEAQVQAPVPVPSRVPVPAPVPGQGQGSPPAAAAVAALKAKESPSSVLSPPPSAVKRRKTIPDYFRPLPPASDGSTADDKGKNPFVASSSGTHDGDDGDQPPMDANPFASSSSDTHDDGDDDDDESMYASAPGPGYSGWYP